MPDTPPTTAATAPDTPATGRHSLAALRARFGEHHRWWVLLTVMIGNMAALMAATTVNVAVPAISARFQLGQQDAQWLATSFMGAMTVSMLSTPWLLQRLGYRRSYAWLLLLLGLGGGLGGLSSHYSLVLAMRVVEGLAAGVLQTIPGVIIMHAFARHEQGRAMGIFGFGTVLAPALGPSVGGVLVDGFGWRAVFFFVLPFCITAALLARRYLPHNAPGGLPMLVALGLPASQVGQVLMPAGFALAVTIPLAGRLADRAPLYRTLTIGLLVMTSSFAVMAGVGSATAVAWVTLWAVMGRIGLGCVIPSLSLSSMRALDGPRIAAGAGTTNFIRQLGGAIGVNGVGIVLEGRLHAHAALGAAGTLRAFHEVFILMAAITAAAAVAAWQMKPRPSPA